MDNSLGDTDYNSAFEGIGEIVTYILSTTWDYSKPHVITDGKVLIILGWSEDISKTIYS